LKYCDDDLRSTVQISNRNYLVNNTYDILLQKLDKFIRKFYKNQLIKGGIYSVTLLIIFFLLVNLLEYYGHFNSITRTIIFYTYLLINLFVISKYIFIPLSKLYRLGKIISHEQAAIIIGKHFSNVNDKLLNTLQLKKIADSVEQDNSLLMAGIDQKIHELEPFPFHSAVNFNVNRKYLKYLILPVIVLMGILLGAPRVITEPSARLVNHSLHFENPLPYQIEVLNETLKVIENDDFTLQVKVTGEELPDKIYLQTGNIQMRLQKIDNINFIYRFSNVQKDIQFVINTDDYKSEEYSLNVLPKPLILDFSIDLDYPGYTQKKDESVHNIGDVIIPEGTKLSWKYNTRNCNTVKMLIQDSMLALNTVSQNVFTYEARIKESGNYSIIAANQFIGNRDTLMYTISVEPDQFPVIVAEEYLDSLNLSSIYFSGVIKDDYGFSLLTFNVTSNEKQFTDTVQISSDITQQQFLHYFEFSLAEVEPGEQINYFFEVWDNDAVNGRKSARTQIRSYALPSTEELDKETEDSNENIKEELSKAAKDSKELKKEIDKLNKKLVDKKELSWKDKEEIKKLMQQHKELSERIEKITEENKKKTAKENQFKQLDEQLLEKQKKLQELLEKLKEDEELKKLFDELEKLMNEADKEEVKEMLENMELSNEEMEKMLDRNLEMFKQFEFEQKLDETIDKLEKLAEEQEKLSEETKSKELGEEESKKEQEKINEKFDELKEDLEKLDELNKELEDSNEFDKMEEKQEEVEESMDDAMEQLDEGQRKKASQSQKNASDQMKEMQQSLASMQQDMMEEGMAEDVESLRDILENLLQLSFDQEDLIDKINAINVNDPLYTQLIQEQFNIKDDVKIVEDSLFALSKRQIMIEPFITKEMGSINKNIEKAIENLNNRRTDQAAGRQQYVMTSLNNLALMLSETLNQMMESMAMQSSKSCKNSGQPKPGQGQSSMKSMKQLQKQLNAQIEKMKGQQKGKKGKPGEQKGSGQQGMSEQLARSAAQQEYIRNQIGKLADQMEKEGDLNSGKQLKKIMEEMEKTETDLVNKMITQETLLRQQKIVTRLLESEKAMMERDREEKREANEARFENYRNPEEFIKYKKLPTNDVELMKRVQPSFKLYYKRKVNQYFFNFDELLEQ